VAEKGSCAPARIFREVPMIVTPTQNVWFDAVTSAMGEAFERACRGAITALRRGDSRAPIFAWNYVR
jgi:hypothetical protein